MRRPQRVPILLVRLLGVALASLGAGAFSQESGATGQVVIELFDGEFGVGGQIRPGCWAGIRLRVTDGAAQPRELLIRIAGEDPDGDTPMFESVIAVSPGVTRDAWSYVRLSAEGVGVLHVSAYEAIATEDEDVPYRAGELLGVGLLQPRAVVPASTGMYGVLNSRGTFGLAQYSLKAQNGDHSPMANERTEIVTQLTAEMLPDRWMGLDGIDVLVWGDRDPTRLGTERPAALIEWVRRGGHLVIVLDALSQEWTNPRANLLAEILPRVTVRAVEPGYDLQALLPMFVAEAGSIDIGVEDASVVVRELVADPLAREGEAIPILADRDGRVLVSRRIVGQGMVTLVGINLNARPFLRFNLPRVEVFWNRLLGRRGVYRSVAEMSNRDTRAGKQNAMSHARDVKRYDDDVARQIATSGRSAAALLLGFIAFGLYWLVAGPVGYSLLKRYGLVRHAWVAYLASAGVFTVIAWSGAMALRPKSVSGRHLSVIDHVYGQPVQRARTWMSLLVPTYGEATVSVESGEGFHNTIAAWSGQDAGIAAVFPDVRGYVVDARSPDLITFPTRATVKQLDAMWAGSPLDDWGMPRPRLASGETGEPRLRIVDGRGVGVLRHQLPGELRDVLIVAVSGQVNVGAATFKTIRGSLAFTALAAQQNVWAPGEDLDLSMIEAWEPLSTTLDRLVPSGRSGLSSEEVLHGNLDDRLRALSFFQALEPPEFSENSSRSWTLPVRWQTHGWDISRWLSQPCIIVVGVLHDGPAPVPMMIGSGRKFESKGVTLVRWVYPLEGNPAGWSDSVELDVGNGADDGG